MTLRVISGEAKGRKLRAVPGDSTRPVTDRVKEALFNILAGNVAGSTWLDLFGGTGAIGIEALSRGAALVRFIDSNRKAIETIRWNLEHCHFTERAEVRRTDAYSLIESHPDRQFDYIYLAPPQYRGMWIEALDRLDSNPGWLNECAWVIVQIHPKEYLPTKMRSMDEFDQRQYSNTLLVFYERPS